MERLCKLYVAVTLLFYTSMYSYAQDDLSIIQGKWIGEAKSQKMGLYEIRNSNFEEVATSNVQNNLFSFAFQPEKEGYYVICGSNPMASTYRYVFYFKPSDDLNFEIERETFRLKGNNTQENKAIESWHNLVQPLEKKAIYFMNSMSTYKDFFPQFEEMLPQIKAFPAAKTTNKTFNQSFEDYKKFDLLHIAEMFISTPRTEHPKGSDYIDFYRNINIKDLTQTTAILNYPSGIGLINRGYTCALRGNNPNLSDDKLREAMKNAQDNILKEQLIVNDTVKGEFILDGAKFIRTYPGIMEYKQKYAQYLITDSQKARFNEIIAKYDDNSAGHDAIDFKFEDVNGKQIALSDFKGKVVYVDVWATWCGPCNREIPHMIKLEESYHNNPNIVFMSVSVDSRKDYDKWKNMLKEKGMGGIQLFAGERSDEIMNPYKIKGIPRFMLFGKDGKVINADAPRPSSSEIKTIINTALK